MSASSAQPPMREWTPQQRREPRLRVGVILDNDARPVIRVRTPDQPYELLGGSHDGRHLDPHTEIRVSLAGNALAAQVEHAEPTSAPAFRLSARHAAPLARGAGLLVREVVAGRGFHWQTAIDQTLSANLEFLPGSHGVIVVNELPLEEYLAGVITAEMSAACPLEFLRAQCVVARSWLLAMTEPKHAGEPFDRCNDDCCQRYQGTGDLSESALAAVAGTRGLVLLDPAGRPLDANYSKCCGGITESPWAVWGLEKPGIAAIVDAPPGAPERRFFPITNQNLDEFLDGAWLSRAACYCSPNVVGPDALERCLGRVDVRDDYFRWTVRYQRPALEDLLRERLTDGSELAELRDLRVRARGVSGRAYVVEIDGADRRGRPLHRRVESEYRIRQVLHRKFLFSSALAIRTERDDDGRLCAIALRGAGWGHGVGLCQIGALGMALAGHDHIAICRHYYPGARPGTVYP